MKKSQLNKIAFNGWVTVLLPSTVIWIGLALGLSIFIKINFGILLLISGFVSYFYWYVSSNIWIKNASNMGLSPKDVYNVGSANSIICNRKQVDKVIREINN